MFLSLAVPLLCKVEGVFIYHNSGINCWKAPHVGLTETCQTFHLNQSESTIWNFEPIRSIDSIASLGQHYLPVPWHCIKVVIINPCIAIMMKGYLVKSGIVELYFSKYDSFWTLFDCLTIFKMEINSFGLNRVLFHRRSFILTGHNLILIFFLAFNLTIPGMFH